MTRNAFYINHPDNCIPDSYTTAILRESDAFSFHRKQEGYSPTPLHELPDLASRLKIGQLYVKDEALRMNLGAFKGTGALYAIALVLSKDSKIDTLCTATDGNHGRAVAWAARKYRKRAVVIVPGDTSSERIEVIKKEGAEVEQIKGTYDEACKLAARHGEQQGWILIQDTASEGYEEIPAYIMAGYLTMFREMENKINTYPLPGIDLVILQAGVGSFAASAIWYYLNRYKERRPKFCIVEPAEADAVCNSLENGRWSTSSASSKTIMAGLNCSTPSSTAFEIIRHGLDSSIRIDDKYSREAVRRFFYSAGNDPAIFSGESGAAGLAGIIALTQDERYKAAREHLEINPRSRVLLINTEEPTDKQSFNNIISK